MAALPVASLSLAALAAADLAVLGAYVLLLLAVGWWLARRENTTASDYFLASRSMPVWAVSLSILATAQSAATFMGAPEQGAKGDLRYLLLNAGVVIAAVIVSTVFLPRYFAMNAQTPYELLERGSGPLTRRWASVWYLGGRLMASGARVYIGAVPFCLAVFGDVHWWGLLVCIVVFMAFGAAFTLASGARGAIWTDVVQVGVYLGAALVIGLVLLNKLPGGEPGLLARVLSGPDGNGLTLIGPLSDNFDLTRPFTPLTAITGWMLLNLAFFAMDQDLTQRLLSCKSAAAAARSLLLNTVVITLPVVAGFVALGILLRLYFKDVSAGSALVGDDRMIVQFAMAHSPAGVAGLMLAGVLAAGPAGINSSLNAMASSFMADLYRPLAPGQSEAHYLRTGKLATVVIGAVMACFAALCVYWHASGGKSIIDFALGVMVYAYAGLIGVFAAVIVTGHIRPAYAIGGLLAGLGSVIAMQFINVGWFVNNVLGISTVGTTMATPWQLVIGASISFTIAMLGTARPASLATTAAGATPR